MKFTPQAGVDEAPSYYSAVFPAKMRQEYEQKWHAEHDRLPGKEVVEESIGYTSDDYDDLRPHMWNFFQSVRTRKAAGAGHGVRTSCRAGCHMANESYFRKSPVAWDETAGEIKSL